MLLKTYAGGRVYTRPPVIVWNEGRGEARTDRHGLTRTDTD